MFRTKHGIKEAQNIFLDNCVYFQHGIFVLRKNKFNPSYLKRRGAAGSSPGQDDDVFLWTNHRVMEWLKEVRGEGLLYLV